MWVGCHSSEASINTKRGGVVRTNEKQGREGTGGSAMTKMWWSLVDLIKCGSSVAHHSRVGQ